VSAVSGPTQVCELPGCPNVVLLNGEHGYCDEHGSHAIVAELRELCGYVEGVESAVHSVANRVEKLDDRLRKVEGDVSDILGSMPTTL
jgi:hypothetical protein